jgi:hypothetical protein
VALITAPLPKALATRPAGAQARRQHPRQGVMPWSALNLRTNRPRRSRWSRVITSVGAPRAIDGDKRLGLAASIAPLCLNGVRLTSPTAGPTNSSWPSPPGELDEVAVVADRLRTGVAPP